MVDVCVYGDSLPAFAAALECAEVGLRVRVLLPAGSTDWPTAPVRDPEGAIAALLERIAAPIAVGGHEAGAALPMRVLPRRVLMRGARGGWSRVPEPAVLGIPAVPVSAEALAFLPAGAAIRAYLDRVKPLLTVGKTHDLGKLVRSRFGEGLFERLVAPLVQERFGTNEVEVAIAAPGLNETFSRAGSLSAAVLAYADRDAAQETGVIPAGGWSAGRDHFVERLGHYGVEFVEVEDPEAALLGPSESGETESESCVLVVDTGARLPVALAEALQELAPRRSRAHARARVGRAAGTPDTAAESAADAVERDAEADAVQIVRLPNGGLWSLRVRAVTDGGWEARLAGPIATGPGDASGDASADAAAALAAAGLEAQGPLRIDVRAAPYTTLSERTNARALLDAERRAGGDLVPIGSEVHGDDVAAAVADAVAETVALRRRLLGISD